MRKMRHFLALLVALTLVLCLQPVTSYAADAETIYVNSEMQVTDEIEEPYDYAANSTPLKLGQANAVVIETEENWGLFSFVPTVSGYYHFNHDADIYAAIGLCDEDGMQLMGYYFYADRGGIPYYLEAGQVYYVFSYYYPDYKAGSYNLYVNKMPAGDNGWMNYQGRWYFYRDGKFVTDWQEIDGKTYFFHRQSYEMLTGLKTIDEAKYYFGTNGVLQINSWAQVDGSWYYFGADGKMVTGWQKVDSNWYFFNEDGMMYSGWLKSGGSWYYLANDMKTGWQKIDNKWYYFSAGGAMQTGWQNIGGTWYYLGNDMKTGWQQISGKWYYFSGNGAMQTGWQNIGGSWYYFGSEMKTGWQKVGNSWYYLGTNGKMAANQWVSSGGKWYYVDGSGKMLTNQWILLSGKWYYLNASGVMVTGTHTIDGKSYTFSANGVWVA